MHGLARSRRIPETLRLLQRVGAAIEVFEVIDERPHQPEKRIRPPGAELGGFVECRHRFGEFALGVRCLLVCLPRLAVDSMQVAVTVAKRTFQQTVVGVDRQGLRERFARHLPLRLTNSRRGRSIVVDDAIGKRHRLAGQRMLQPGSGNPPQTRGAEVVIAVPQSADAIEFDRRHLCPQPFRAQGDHQLVPSDERRHQQERDSRDSAGQTRPRHRWCVGGTKDDVRWGSGSGSRTGVDSHRWWQGVSIVLRQRWHADRRRLVNSGSGRGPSFAFGLGHAAGRHAFEIFANGAGIAVSIGRRSGEELGDDRPQRQRTRLAERIGRLQRSDPVLQPARVGRAVRLDAGQHLVEQHADCPEVGVGVDLAGLGFLAPATRRCEGCAEVVARHFPAERQRFGDAKVENLDLVGPEEPDVSRLQVAVQQGVKPTPVDRRLQSVRGFEELAQLNRDADGALRRQRAGGENLREIPAVEIFHRDVEVAAFGAVLVDDRHVLADAAELLVQLRAPALGLEYVVAVGVGADRNQLERDVAIVSAVGGEEHDGHAAASDLADDFVRPDANALEARRSSPSSPDARRRRQPGANASTHVRATLPVKSRLAGAAVDDERSTDAPGVPFRMNTLSASRADAERIVNAAPRLSGTRCWPQPQK